MAWNISERVYSGEWMEWFGDDSKVKSVVFQSKLLGFCALVYFTWKARNFAIHRDIMWTPSDCSVQIIRDCKEPIFAKCKFATRDVGWKLFLAR